MITSKITHLLGSTPTIVQPGRILRELADEQVSVYI